MYVKNPSNQAQEVTFTMVLPSEAFISNFSMILNNGQVNCQFPISSINKTLLSQIDKLYRTNQKLSLWERIVIMVIIESAFEWQKKPLFESDLRNMLLAWRKRNQQRASTTQPWTWATQPDSSSGIREMQIRWKKRFDENLVNNNFKWKFFTLDIFV